MQFFKFLQFAIRALEYVDFELAIINDTHRRMANHHRTLTLCGDSHFDAINKSFLSSAEARSLRLAI